MKQTMLLYLHSLEPPTVSVLLLDENDTILQTTSRIHLSELTITPDQDIMVIVPTTEILLTQAELPKLSIKRLQQALPFAIEEQLIEDVTELHFAIGKYNANGRWPAAIVSQDKLLSWLETLKQWNIIPIALIPAPLALPYTQNHWTVYCIDDYSIVRTGNDSGFVCEPENLVFYLDSQLAESTLPPLQIDFYAKKAVAVKLENNVAIAQKKLADKQLMESLFQGIKQSPYINLLQGAFGTKRKRMEVKKLWLYAGYATLAWIMIGLINHFISFVVLHHRAATIDQRITAIYQRQFPGDKLMISPKEHLESKLRKLAATASNQSFLVLLSAAGKAISQSTGIRLLNMEYRDKQLTLAITANTSDNLDNLTQLLQQQGLSVKEQSAEIVAGRVKATLMINGSGA